MFLFSFWHIDLRRTRCELPLLVRLIRLRVVPCVFGDERKPPNHLVRVAATRMSATKVLKITAKGRPVHAQRQSNIAVSGQCLGHLGSDAGTFEVGDEEVPTGVEVGVVPAWFS